MAEIITSQTNVFVSFRFALRGATKLAAGDVISLKKNGVELCSYTVPQSKTAEIDVSFSGDEG